MEGNIEGGREVSASSKGWRERWKREGGQFFIDRSTYFFSCFLILHVFRKSNVSCFLFL